MLSLHGLPPVLALLAAALIVLAAAVGMGISLVRGAVAVYLVRRRRMPPFLRRLYRASQPVRRHHHLHTHSWDNRWASRAEE